MFYYRQETAVIATAMKSSLAIAVITTLMCALQGDGASLRTPIAKKIDIMQAYISEAYKLIDKECPSSIGHFKRQLANGDLPLQTHLNIQKKVYFKLLAQLRDCRNSNGTLSTTQTTVKATKLTVTSTLKTSKITTPAARPTTTKKECNRKLWWLCVIDNHLNNLR